MCTKIYSHSVNIRIVAIKSLLIVNTKSVHAVTIFPQSV